MKKVTFKYKDDAMVTSPSKAKIVLEAGDLEQISWQDIVIKFQQFMSKLGYGFMSTDVINLPGAIEQLIDEREEDKWYVNDSTKYHRISQTIDAVDIATIFVRLDDDSIKLPTWVEDAVRNNEIKLKEDFIIDIKTLNGFVEAGIDSMLAKGINGELYPIRKDIFKQIYAQCGGKIN